MLREVRLENDRVHGFDALAAQAAFSFAMTPPQCHTAGDHELSRLHRLGQLVHVLHVDA